MSTPRVSRRWLLVVVVALVVLVVGVAGLVSPEPRYPGADPF